MSKRSRYICAHCKKPINTFMKDMENWGYKLNQKGQTKYYCGYDCYMAELNKKRQREDRQLRAKLMNTYGGGELSLKECQFLDDFFCIMSDDLPVVQIRRKIIDRKSFIQFIKEYYSYIKKTLDI